MKGKTLAILTGISVAAAYVAVKSVIKCRELVDEAKDIIDGDYCDGDCDSCNNLDCPANDNWDDDDDDDDDDEYDRINAEIKEAEAEIAEFGKEFREQYEAIKAAQANPPIEKIEKNSVYGNIVSQDIAPETK